jgi:hypothetical protein
MRWFRNAANILPADVLNVVVATDGQPDAALQTTPFEHRPAISRGHALAEAMHSNTPSDFGLISSLRHFIDSEK